MRAWVVARRRDVQERQELVTSFSCLDMRLEMTGCRERQRRRRARYAGTPAGSEALVVGGRKVASQVCVVRETRTRGYSLSLREVVQQTSHRGLTVYLVPRMRRR